MSKPSLRTAIMDFLREEDGPTAAEYAVMASLIAAFLVASVSVLATATNDSFTSSANAIIAAN